ncbi:MAG: hypothetical protein ACWA6Y_01890 [Polaromonas sp.]
MSFHAPGGCSQFHASVLPVSLLERFVVMTGQPFGCGRWVDGEKYGKNGLLRRCSGHKVLFN